MNLGLSYLSQIKDGSSDALGFVRQTIQQLITNIGQGYHKQHNANDTHGTITATGSISERGRTAAMGVWTSLMFLASYYTASASTWTVTASQQVTLKYMLIGTTLFVTFYINTSTLGGTPASLFITLPLNARSNARACHHGAHCYRPAHRASA